MKKPFFFALAYAALLALLTLGVGILTFAPREERMSESENRMLQGFPALRGEDLLSGAFMGEFESYLSDAFPARDRLVRASRAALSLFGERDEEYAIKEAIAQQMDQASDPEEAAPSENGPKELRPSAAPAETAADPESSGTTVPPEARDAAFWLVRPDGRRDVEEQYPAANLAYLAPVLDEYRACLPADGRVLFLNAPVSSDAHAIDLTGTRTDWGYDLDEALQALTGDGVIIYDATDILRPWLGKEDLYPTGDHHWHAQTASHMADAMAKDLGVPAAGFYDYMYRLELDFRGDPCTPEQLQSMDLDRNNRRIPVPVTPVESYVVTFMDQLKPTVYLESDRIEGYGIYLGGLHRPWRLFVTGYHTGRTALVIGDSFYHAFLPYITPYYDRILSTDLRDGMYRTSLAGGSIRQYMEHYEVDDVYLVMCRYTSVNEYVYQNRLERYLNTDYGWGEES